MLMRLLSALILVAVICSYHPSGAIPVRSAAAEGFEERRATKPIRKRKSSRRPVRAKPPPAEPTRNISEVLGLSGSLRTAYFQKDRAFFNEREIGSGSMWLSMRPDEFWSLRTVLEMNAEASSSANRPSVFDIREAYIESSLGQLDVRIGRQIIPWGRADKINPTDFLTVRDTTRLVVDDEDQRLAQGAIQVTGHFGDSRVVLVAQPEWREPRYAISLLPPGVSLSYRKPVDESVPHAVKFEQISEGFDFSLSYFAGPDRVPDLSVLSVSPVLDLGLEFNRIRGYGADFAFNLGALGCRGELAYVATSDQGGDNPLIKNSFYSGVIGVDRNFGESININVQYLFRATERWSDPAEISDANSAALARLVNLISNQQHEHLQGIVARIAWKMLSDSLTIEAGYLLWFYKGDSVFKPRLSYTVRDDVKLTVGGDFYQGPPDSFLGRFADLSALYSELRWSF
jgi:hypothetical protein